MSQDKKNLGFRGEQLASQYLQSKGYTLLQKNFRAKQYGEVDLIVQKNDLLVFVEVKTRLSTEFGLPEEAITHGKLHELKKMVDYYYNIYPQTKLSPQIDAIAIVLDPNFNVESLKHFENITL